MDVNERIFQPKLPSLTVYLLHLCYSQSQHKLSAPSASYADERKQNDKRRSVSQILALVQSQTTKQYFDVYSINLIIIILIISPRIRVLISL